MKLLKEYIKVKNKLQREKQFNRKIEINKIYRELYGKLELIESDASISYKDYETIQVYKVYVNGIFQGYEVQYFNKKSAVNYTILDENYQKIA